MVRQSFTTETWAKVFEEMPFTNIPSNAPYNTAGHPEEAAARKVQKQLFIEGRQYNPDLGYPNLHSELLRASETQLLSLLIAVDAIEAPELEKQTLYEQAARKLAELYRHQEIIRGLGVHGIKHAQSVERAAELSLDLFGRPDRTVFRSLLAQDRQKAADLLQHNVSGSEIAKELLDLTGRFEIPEGTTSVELNDRAMETLAQDADILFPGAVSALTASHSESIPPLDSLPYINQALRAMHMYSWKAVLVDGSAAATSTATEEIHIGKNRSPFTTESLVGVGLHELIHAYRAFNAHRRSRAIERNALPGSSNFEEGFCIGFEQAVTGQKRIPGLAYYLSLGLQLGLDHDNKSVRRGFRETQEILWRRAVVDALAAGSKIEDISLDDLKGKAYDQSLRTIRGGALDARDLSYFESGRKANQWLNEVAELPQVERLAKLRWALSARFDPTNPLDCQIIPEPIKFEVP